MVKDEMVRLEKLIVLYFYTPDFIVLCGDEPD